MITGHSRRIALYVALSAVSGVGWAGIYLLLAGDGLGGGLMPTTYLLFGAVSGVTVGLLMAWIYRAGNPLYTILSAPLALWIGMFSFLVQVFLAQGQPNHQAFHHLVIAAGGYATLAMLTPLVLLTLLALANGWLLRSVLRYRAG